MARVGAWRATEEACRQKARPHEVADCINSYSDAQRHHESSAFRLHGIPCCSSVQIDSGLG